MHLMYIPENTVNEQLIPCNNFPTNKVRLNLVDPMPQINSVLWNMSLSRGQSVDGISKWLTGRGASFRSKRTKLVHSGKGKCVPSVAAILLVALFSSSRPSDR